MTLSSKKWFKRVFWFVFIVAVLLYGLNFQYENGRFDQPSWNTFLQEDGLFSFDYRNDYEVHENKGIYYVQEISKGKVVWQIFEATPDRAFDWAYECEEDICYSSSSPEDVILNLQLYPGEAENRFEMLSRAETLEWLLPLRYLNKDFSEYAADCFDDITAEDELAGYVCFAKDKGIVVGIGGSFYPDSSINLWGVLKILFLVFDEDDYSFDESELDESMFELMTEYHYAYELLAKSYYEGLFANVSGKDIWPNRAVYKAEAEQIAENFMRWQDGEVLRDYTGDDDYEKAGYVYILNEDWAFDFISLPVADFVMDVEREGYVMETGNGIDLYVEEDGRVYEFLGHFDDLIRNDIDDVQLSYDEERLLIDVLFEMENGEELYYQAQIADDEFAYLAEDFVSTVDDQNVLPNSLGWEPSGLIYKVELFLSDDSFEEILEDRTVVTRYPAYLRTTGVDGLVDEHSVLIKTRGNANRGYIKSSYTVESFNPRSLGPDEFKLRSLIADESMMKEKLIYSLFENLGYLRPEFGEVLLEINGVPFGFYQLTEAIKDDFFLERSLETDYFYARNITSPYPANLSYFSDEDIIKTHYKIDGFEDNDEAEEKFMQFLYQIEKEDEDLLADIDIQNIFDYAFTVYALNMPDSLMHNYYLYQEEGIWKLFLWDADEAFFEIPEISKDGFKAFAANREGLWNELIWFVFDNMSNEEFNAYWDDLLVRWTQVDLVAKLDEYLAKYEEFYRYDNELWNGRYLERMNPVFDTLGAIAELREQLVYIDEQISALVGE